MSIFEILILVLLTIFVISNLYFLISNRILSNKDRNRDEERFKEQMNWEEQLKDLSHKVYEFQSENLRLNNIIREWIDKYNKVVFSYNDLNAELDKLRAKKSKPAKKIEKEELENDNVDKKD